MDRRKFLGLGGVSMAVAVFGNELTGDTVKHIPQYVEISSKYTSKEESVLSVHKRTSYNLSALSAQEMERDSYTER